jgi:hypothetical protein
LHGRRHPPPPAVIFIPLDIPSSPCGLLRRCQSARGAPATPHLRRRHGCYRRPKERPAAATMQTSPTSSAPLHLQPCFGCMHARCSKAHKGRAKETLLCPFRVCAARQTPCALAAPLLAAAPALQPPCWRCGRLSCKALSGSGAGHLLDPVGPPPREHCLSTSLLLGSVGATAPAVLRPPLPPLSLSRGDDLETNPHFGCNRRSLGHMPPVEGGERCAHVIGIGQGWRFEAAEARKRSPLPWAIERKAARNAYRKRTRKSAQSRRDDSCLALKKRCARKTAATSLAAPAAARRAITRRPASRRSWRGKSQTPAAASAATGSRT